MSDAHRGDVRVIKVGGSILRTREDVRLLVDRLGASDDPVVVVVSALNGTTDGLIGTIDRVLADPAATEGALDALRRRHLEVATVDGASRRQLETDLDAILAGLERALSAIAAAGEASEAARDAVLATGERLSARVLARSLAGAGLDSEAIDADDLGVITDGTFGRATVDLAPTAARVRPRLAARLDAGTIPVVTGYFGRDASGTVTTFGRGGSDYSGAILARALDATALEVWKDVDGVLTTDPARVEAARPIPYMTYDEAAELAYLGVRVLHPRTLEPVRDRQIPVIVRNHAPSTFAGTHIGPPREERASLRAVGAREGFGIVRMHGSAMAYEPGVGRRVFTVLSDHGINVVNMAASQATFALLVDGADVDRAAAVLRDAAIPTVESVSPERGYALVCVVGRDIGLREGVAGRVFTAVGEAGVNVNMISVGSSNVALSFVVEEADLDAALVALHDGLLDADWPGAGQRSPPAGDD